ncbi:hypothetical protein EOL70_02860 [Leucothrix sargassi]|nr:hypothetical protein EOL70_02860 [Leucothrix sargassi]
MSKTKSVTRDDAALEISAFYYTVADQNILIESDIKTEIVDSLTIFPMPHAPAWCKGMVSLRGKIIPVLDLAYVLNTKQAERARWLLILEASPLPLIAIKIDKLPARISYKEDSIKPLSDSADTQWLKAEIQTDETRLLQADHHTLFQHLINENQAQTTVQNLETTDLADSSEEEV